MISIIPNPKPHAFTTPVISPKYFNNPHSFFSFKFPPQRRCSQIQASSSSVLPLLPFPIEQVLVPSEAKTLHLYEARYLALLEESLFKNKQFVHFVLDPIVIGGTSFAARYGCLVIIEKVERLEVGALVSIRGVGRVNILDFKQVQPYLTGEVTPQLDKIPPNMTRTSSKVLELKAALLTLNSLEIKLKANVKKDFKKWCIISKQSKIKGTLFRKGSIFIAPQEALLQTQIINSLVWAEKDLPLESMKSFIPHVAERVSFAAIQPVSGATQSELLRLQKEKLRAMDTNDTLERLEISMELVRNNISMVAAKLAIQSLEVP